MTVAIIQARMSSTRLPNKVLMKINNRPLLDYMIERVKCAKSVDKVVVATSADISDDSIANFCRDNNVLCFRGSLEDVLDRYYSAAKYFKADTIVRLTGDCPLIDPQIIDKLVSIYDNSSYDYVANTTPPKWTFPVGMDVEVFSMSGLEKVWRIATKPSDREHVTFYFWKNSKLFSIFRCDLEKDLSRYRLTVDYPEDFEVVKAIFNNLYSENRIFSLDNMIQFLDKKPEIFQINSFSGSSRGWRSNHKK
jgi:spore coat polysaccharide biosynthesis protein SpsF